VSELLALLRSLPGQFLALAKAELAQLKAELTRKAIHAAIGISAFLFAVILLLFLVPVLLAAAVLALALVFPGWLAALLVAAGIVILAGMLVLVGILWFKRMTPRPETFESMKKDVQAIRGLGRYDR
jgi:hypothetical protein